MRFEQIKAGMVIELDHSKFPNMANIDEPFKDATFDPGRKHSIPYMWGTLGIGYRKSKVDAKAVDSWKLLLDSDKLAGRISLLGDASLPFADCFRQVACGPCLASGWRGAGKPNRSDH